MSKPTVHIENWIIIGKTLYGKAKDHPRFAPDTEIRTSTILDMPSTPQPGDSVETRNTIYVLGKTTHFERAGGDDE
jgi:hypothetical protein